MDIEVGKLSRKPSRRTGAGKASVVAASGGRRVEPKSRPEASFDRKFLEIQRRDIKGELNALIKNIDSQAKLIEKSLTFDALQAYREMVQKFVGIAVNDLFKVEEKLSISPTGRKKSMLLVKKINAELETLTDDFLGRQKNLINFLSRLDQIKGMLLDLYS